MSSKVKELIHKHKEKINLILLAGALIAGYNCLARADYNIVSYAYIYYVWYQIDDKVITISNKIGDSSE